MQGWENVSLVKGSTSFTTRLQAVYSNAMLSKRIAIQKVQRFNSSGQIDKQYNYQFNCWYSRDRRTDD